LHPSIVKAQAATLARMRDCGVKICFVVYDLLWTRMPPFFLQTAVESLYPWLEVVTASDGAICISKAVADELYHYICAHPPNRSRPFDIGWFHLGTAALTGTSHPKPNKGPDLGRNAAGPTPFILMVGTIEPRKGHAQALAAFEDLWRRGADMRLVIIGKQGWMVESLVDRLRSHPELNRRLFWYAQAGDEPLEALYRTASGLLVASEGEGFGLPLIEAAHHRCPILARDIPVFREVAGEHASYFRAANAVELADALANWIAALQKGTAPQSAGMPLQTWAQSAEQLLSVILGGNWYRRFDPKAVAHGDSLMVVASGSGVPAAGTPSSRD